MKRWLGLTGNTRILEGPFSRNNLSNKKAMQQYPNYLKWKKPPEGWTKLNTNGGVENNNRMARCGGILRNHRGEWICGFTKTIEVCSVMEAELWGILLGLRVAVDKSRGKIIVEYKAKDVIDCLKGTKASLGNYQTLIKAC